jgi:thiamine pyrophosphokinase
MSNARKKNREDTRGGKIGIVNTHFHVRLNPERTTAMCGANTCHTCHAWPTVFHGDFYSVTGETYRQRSSTKEACRFRGTDRSSHSAIGFTITSRDARERERERGGEKEVG